MKKLTKKQIEEIKKIQINWGEKNKGILALARKYNVTPNAIRYHNSEKFREYIREYQRRKYNEMTKKEKKEYFDKKKHYQREYQRRRYNQDEKFREKQLGRSKAYQKNKTGEKK